MSTYTDRLARATPSWANLGRIYAVYDQAWELRQSGIDASVDHEYPLAGDWVCGLHVHENLRVVLAKDNSKKGARRTPIKELPRLVTDQMDLFL